MQVRRGPNQEEEAKMNQQKILDRIRTMKIPGKAKAELRRLWRRAGRVWVAVIGLMRSRMWLRDALTLSIAIVFLWPAVPLLCTGMAMLLVTSAALELRQRLRGDLSRRFKPVL